MPVKQTTALYHLQQLDDKLAAINKRLSEIANLLDQNTAVRAARSSLEQAEQDYHQWQSKQKSLELERAQLKGESDQVENRLYSGNIHNPRELTDLQDKMAELRRRHADLEEPLLEAMLALEEGEEAVQAAKDTLEQVLAEQAETLGALRDEQSQLTSQHDALETDIEKARAAINAPHLLLYDELLIRLRGKAVTQVNGDECGVCGVQLTSQWAQKVKRGEVLTCPTCERILHIG
jgi:uncharacterized protein